ncbi:V8-like Glu-specific endopeptidase [Stackebrandtia albiflava]|uniref:V8-like Glu-specific endopeptidase n=1 Tax=Stackebrandtia albiflava TaxID=406432 RepID=A0A562V1F6_9ACTN|nr:serine protease [Stackebrandtia albiflava]TWJ11750.1 V8-like Glu-specific endopeptidase [Stackebrandtia albiflava]
MRRTVTLVAIGMVAAATPLLLGPVAEAVQQEDRPVRQAQQPVESGTMEIGTVEDVGKTLSYLTSAEQTLRYPGSKYVKVHFSRLDLLPEDYITVSSPDGSESHRIEAADAPRWSTSITGDTAVVELHTAGGVVSDVMSRYGVEVDKVARGFTDTELAEERESHRRTESICGGDDQQDAVCYESDEPEVYDNASPVARLLIGGTTLCTAFRVGEDNRMLTNNHCFETTAQARDTEVWFDYACRECGGEEVRDVVKVNGDEVLDTDFTYDYTLFTVDDFAKIEEFGHLTLSDRKSRQGEKLYIPQHPSGAPSQIAMVSDADGGACRVDDPAFDGYAADSDVSYYCDTEFGSSGSPVLSRDTHEVIALHHFGGCPNSGVRSDILLDRIGSML